MDPAVPSTQVTILNYWSRIFDPPTGGWEFLDFLVPGFLKKEEKGPEDLKQIQTCGPSLTVIFRRKHHAAAGQTLRFSWISLKSLLFSPRMHIILALWHVADAPAQCLSQTPVVLLASVVGPCLFGLLRRASGASETSPWLCVTSSSSRT